MEDLFKKIYNNKGDIGKWASLAEGYFVFPKLEGPILNFISKDHDFGLITEGEVVIHTFKFTNTGNSPLIISEATGSCGCTTPSWSGDPIKPGENGYIEVKFDSDGRVGSNSKTVTITANTIPNKTYLKISANVKKL